MQVLTISRSMFVVYIRFLTNSKTCTYVCNCNTERNESDDGLHGWRLESFWRVKREIVISSSCFYAFLLRWLSKNTQKKFLCMLLHTLVLVSILCFAAISGKESRVSVCLSVHSDFLQCFSLVAKVCLHFEYNREMWEDRQVSRYPFSVFTKKCPKSLILKASALFCISCQVALRETFTRLQLEVLLVQCLVLSVLPKC